MYNLICLHCKKQFLSRITKRKFCSQKCFKQYAFKDKAPHWQGGQIERSCLICKKIFYVDPNVVKKGKGVFCSRSCAGKRSYGKKPLAPKKELFCVVCGDVFYDYVSKLSKDPKRGKCCSKQCRIKYTQRCISGKHHYRWKGGVTKKTALERAQMATRNWSRLVKVRDDFTCQSCGIRCKKGLGRTVRLESHHIKSWVKYPELRHDLSNGVTLCKDCHNKTKKRNTPNKIIYKALLKKEKMTEVCLGLLKGNAL